MKVTDWKLTQIIKKSIKETLKRFSKRTPKIVYNTFYGAYGIAPYNLAVWFFFKN